jgi:hypothetical protein
VTIGSSTGEPDVGKSAEIRSDRGANRSGLGSTTEGEGEGEGVNMSMGLLCLRDDLGYGSM